MSLVSVEMREYRLKIVSRSGFDEYLPVYASTDAHAYRRMDEIFMSMHNNGTMYGDYDWLGDVGKRHEDVDSIELLHYDTGAVIASFKM